MNTNDTRSTASDREYETARAVVEMITQATTDPGYLEGALAAFRLSGLPGRADQFAAAVAQDQQHAQLQREQEAQIVADETRKRASSRGHRLRGLLAAAAHRLSGSAAEIRTPVAALEQPAESTDPQEPDPAEPELPAEPVADPEGVFGPDEMPPLPEIEAEAARFFLAATQTRDADRVKRATRKLLDRLPAGRYGAWTVERVDNAREVADLDAIRKIFQANGLGAVPMKPCAPSLKVNPAPVEAVPELIEAELHALAGAR